MINKKWDGVRVCSDFAMSELCHRTYEFQAGLENVNTIHGDHGEREARELLEIPAFVEKVVPILPVGRSDARGNTTSDQLFAVRPNAILYSNVLPSPGSGSRLQYKTRRRPGALRAYQMVKQMAKRGGTIT
jgi:hypothetical protein